MLFFHGLPNPVPIFLAFFTVKLIGYSLAGWTLQRYYKSNFNFLLFAVVRIVAGFVVGLAFLAAGFTGLSLFEEFGRAPDLVQGTFVVVPLVLSRLFVWALLVWAIFERGNFRWKRFAVVVVLGTIWSCLLDTVAVSVTSLIHDPVDRFTTSSWSI
jgi:hypothetical protein